MRITMKQVETYAEMVGVQIKLDLAVNPRNGYYGLDCDNNKRNLFCGSLKEVYRYLKGMNDGIFFYIQATSNFDPLA